MSVYEQMERANILSRLAAVREEQGIPDADDVIPESPGKWGGKPMYVAYYWSIGMDGGARYVTSDDDDTDMWVFRPNDLELELVDGLKEGMGDCTEIVIFEDDQGFIHYEWR